MKMRPAAMVALALAVAIPAANGPAVAQPAADAAPQRNDEEYGKLISQHLMDKRISTELVDHLPASDTVPSPLKFFGRIPGTPKELTYAKDIHRYYQELARTSPRVRYLKIGETEEGRDIVVLVIADEATLSNLDKYKGDLAALTDPRRTTDAQAREIIRTAKPIYWVTSGIHSSETGGPETLIETAYRLAVEETPFIRNIRDNIITFITPVLEVDGRERMVDTYYYGKETGKPKPPLMYWGKYVAHDNNRDGLGQFLKLTQHVTKTLLEWHPTVLHDLHEAQSYLYASTGSGPYNVSLDPLASQEWWLLAQTEVMEMTKRGVPGVWTYGFYDGWVPNYMFWIAMTHNAFGRFYEVQSYGPDPRPELKLPPTTTSREWYRPNPPLPSIAWGPRNNVNIQQSALLIALNKVAEDRALYLENYWLKNKRAVEKGKAQGEVNAWVVPAAQTARLNAVDMLNALIRQGVEVSIADQAFAAGGVQVAAGDYVIRADQPFRTLVDMYTSVQTYPTGNPRPYDDTGWTLQYMRNVDLKMVRDPAILNQTMTRLSGEIAPRGMITGSGTTILVDHNGDNALMSFRFRLKDVPMMAAQEAFQAGGRKYAAGTFIIPDADRALVERVVAQLGLSGQAVPRMPKVKSHPLTVPRIGYMHSWLRTQDEGWWRAALDHYDVPYTYFADIKAREGGLRQKYDVIIYPTVGGGVADAVNGVPKDGPEPIPYKKTDLTPNLGTLDSADDIRGGLGTDGMAELKRFVEEGGTLIGDGTTVEALATYGIAQGLSVSTPPDLYTKGAIMRGVFADKASPLTYGYRGEEMPIYFSQAPVLTVGRVAPVQPGRDLVQNITPNAVPVKITPWRDGDIISAPPPPEGLSSFGGRGGREATQKPRTIMRFPEKAETILLSGMLSGGEALASKALVVDVPRGKGHMVLYALRPFWRWQTQGSYFLGFNAIINWDRLDVGAPPVEAGKN
ncbi:M14 family zinc carboxypeptidase [Sphingosinicella rhizophila]|uniref:M14 family zinc carboxypeptidase n=1 Tax=Sphingosinicella rhizophila TaxID=3050082 RepID=A0ABU3Q8E8_9SPHN|nr:M14 family zinc carboxypeptidase [Sphingosinicella sp. GR2756]MDT9599374.1 M14 family zinc carboxypeptidase [Sphingosinicella sp. GR2756]